MLETRSESIKSEKYVLENFPVCHVIREGCTDPELVESVDGGRGEIGEQVVEEAQRAEGLADSLESVVAHGLDEVALEVERGERVQAGQRAAAARPGQLAQPVLRQVQERQAAQPRDRLGDALLTGPLRPKHKFILLSAIAFDTPDTRLELTL